MPEKPQINTVSGLKYWLIDWRDSKAQLLQKFADFYWESRYISSVYNPINNMNGNNTGSEEIIHLRVKAQDREELHFKIKLNTPLKKLMDKYAARIGHSNLNGLNFLYDGTRIYPGSTPEGLRMRDGDEIEVITAQVGGGFN